MEEKMEKIFDRKLPAFGAECFGSAIMDTGRFARHAGFSPAPNRLLYEKGGWFVDLDWHNKVVHDLNAQPGAWVSSLVDVSVKHIERDLGRFKAKLPPERLANNLCQLYGSFGPPTLALAMTQTLLTSRVEGIMSHLGIDGIAKSDWMNLFAYPLRKTAAMEEREVFLDLAKFVRAHSLDRGTRRTIWAHVKKYRHLGKTTPSGRPFSFDDLMVRISNLEAPPAKMKDNEKKTRKAVFERVKAFLNNTALDAPERDAIRAYQASSYWKLRSEELWVLLELHVEESGHLLEETYKKQQIIEHWQQMRPVELSHYFADPGEDINWTAIASRDARIEFTKHEAIFGG